MTENCPACNAEMYVYNYWWKVVVPDSNESEFEFTCPNCEEMLTIQVEQMPLFVIALKQESERVNNE